MLTVACQPGALLRRPPSTQRYVACSVANCDEAVMNTRQFLSLFTELRRIGILGSSRNQAPPVRGYALVRGGPSRTIRVEAAERLVQGPIARPHPAHQVEGEGGHEQQRVQRYRCQEDPQHDHRDGAVHYLIDPVHAARLARCRTWH